MFNHEGKTVNIIGKSRIKAYQELYDYIEDLQNSNEVSTNENYLGENVLARNIYEKKLGHTMRDRQINASRISKLVKYISDQKVNVIVSVLSNFPKWLKWNRKNIKNYFEVYLKTDLDILKNRRSKLYSKKTKNVIGVDLKFNEPIRPNIIIKNSNNKNDIDTNAIKILKKIKKII